LTNESRTGEIEREEKIRKKQGKVGAGQKGSFFANNVKYRGQLRPLQLGKQQKRGKAPMR
jgi:hypothetical protein